MSPASFPMRSRRRAPDPTSRRDRGFSLIDLMIALFVTTLGALAVCSLIIASSSANSCAKDHQIAANAARHEIEILRGMNAHLLADRTDAPLLGSVPQLQELANSAGSLTISDYPSVPGVKAVTVTITWETRASPEPRSLSMSTLVTQDGLGP